MSVAFRDLFPFPDEEKDKEYDQESENDDGGYESRRDSVLFVGVVVRWGREFGGVGARRGRGWAFCGIEYEGGWGDDSGRDRGFNDGGEWNGDGGWEASSLCSGQLAERVEERHKRKKLGRTDEKRDG